jgi:hypothetical protein
MSEKVDRLLRILLEQKFQLMLITKVDNKWSRGVIYRPMSWGEVIRDFIVDKDGLVFSGETSKMGLHQPRNRHENRLPKEP